jgi:hypothetical protein
MTTNTDKQYTYVFNWSLLFVYWIFYYGTHNKLQCARNSMFNWYDKMIRMLHVESTVLLQSSTNDLKQLGV